MNELEVTWEDGLSFFEEDDKVFYFENVYDKKGREIDVRDPKEMLNSAELLIDIEAMRKQEDREMKAIMKCNLPYFLLKITPKVKQMFAEDTGQEFDEWRGEFKTDYLILGCRFADDNDFSYRLRLDTVVEVLAREERLGFCMNEIVSRIVSRL